MSVSKKNIKLLEKFEQKLSVKRKTNSNKARSNKGKPQTTK